MYSWKARNSVDDVRNNQSPSLWRSLRHSAMSSDCETWGSALDAMTRGGAVMVWIREVEGDEDGRCSRRAPANVGY